MPSICPRVSLPLILGYGCRLDFLNDRIEPGCFGFSRVDRVQSLAYSQRAILIKVLGDCC